MRKLRPPQCCAGPGTLGQRKRSATSSRPRPGAYSRPGICSCPCQRPARGVHPPPPRASC
ncbi:hypothetical protein T492DRAFT_1048306 [Pavlovales sp. CCMP2436]|nr:hypothetical protein T492DRAFT_1048306 [Pavlovales sp. CCMP2436]